MNKDELKNIIDYHLSHLPKNKWVKTEILIKDNGDNFSVYSVETTDSDGQLQIKHCLAEPDLTTITFKDESTPNIKIVSMEEQSDGVCGIGCEHDTD